MKRLFPLALVLFSLGSTSCSSTLSQPFQGLKQQPITVYKLQNYEPPAAQAGTASAIPAQIQQWLSAGAQLLPPGLLPQGLIPGTAPATATDGPRFHNFRILGSMVVNDASQRDEILELFGKQSNFHAPRQGCMYAEFGFQIGQGQNGALIGQPSNNPPADILVSLSCEQVQMFNYNWPYGGNNGLDADSSKKVVELVRKIFGG